MTDSQKLSVNDLAKLVGGRVIGDGSQTVERIANLDSADKSEIAYVDSKKFFDAARNSKASCLIVPVDAGSEFKSAAVIEVANPKLAFSIVGAALNPAKSRDAAIHPLASVSYTHLTLPTSDLV